MTLTLKPDISSRVNKRGLAAVTIRVTQDRKVTAANINLWIEPEFWDRDRAMVKNRHKKAKELNKVIAKKLEKTESFIHNYYLKNDQQPHRKQVIAFIQGKQLPAHDDFELIAWAVDFIEQEWPASENFDTNMQYKYALNDLRNFQPRVYSFDLTVDFLKRLHKYLNRILSPVTAGRRMNRVRTIVLRAIEEGRLKPENNPFLGYRVKNGKTKKNIPLKPQELAALQLMKPDSPEQELSKDFFLFSTYAAGARPGDVLFCDVNQIGMTMVDVIDQNTREVKSEMQYFWQYTMRKTGAVHRVVLIGKALEIYQKYGRKPKGYLFPYLDDSQANDHSNKTRKLLNKQIIEINKQLQKFGERMDLNFSLTTYTARYTYSAMSSKATTDSTSRSKSMGHSSMHTTNLYPSEINQAGIDKVIRETWEKFKTNEIQSNQNQIS